LSIWHSSSANLLFGYSDSSVITANLLTSCVTCHAWPITGAATQQSTFLIVLSGVMRTRGERRG